MFKRVLIALQKESEAHDLAVVARRLAAGDDAAVLSLHVRKVDLGDEGDLERYEDAEAVAAVAAGEARELGLSAEYESLTIDRDRGVGRAIADVAHGWRADVVVMGSRRLGDFAAAVQGSVSHEVIRLAPCPVVIAGDGFTQLRTILLAVDGSPAAEASVELVRSLALDVGATVSVVHVPQPIVINGFAAGGWYAPTPEDDFVTEDVADRLTKAGVKAQRIDMPLYPPVATAIAQAAEELSADLVVVGSRGLGDVAAFIRGSVSHELLHATRRPVLVTRAADK